jgi:hypothetical protein
MKNINLPNKGDLYAENDGWNLAGVELSAGQKNYKIY